MINLYHLKYFNDAAMAKSLSEAALKNRVSRSAISQAIRALEQTLNVELLHHQKNSFQLTTEGSLLSDRCREVFSLIGNIKDEILGAKTVMAGELLIAASHSISISLLPKFLKVFSKEYPKISVTLYTGNSFRVRDLIRSRQIDLGLGLNDPNLSEFSKLSLKKGHFVLAAEKNKEKISKATRFLVGDQGEEVAFLRRAFQKRFQVPLPIQMEIQSWEVIAALVSQGLGVGLIPDFMLSGLQKINLKVVKTDLELSSYELCAFCRNHQLLSKGGRVFLEDFRKFIF